MKPRTLAQIRMIRDVTERLARLPHVLRCRCCRSDLEYLAINCDAPYAIAFLTRIEARILERSTEPA